MLKYEKYVEIWDLSQMYFSESSGPPKFWMLSKLYLFLRILSLAETFKSWKNNERWRNIYWWICYFAPVISHKNWKELKWNKWIKWNTKKKKKIVLFFGSQNQKLTETFAINNSAFTFSFQFKFCNIALCYKMKVPC